MNLNYPVTMFKNRVLDWASRREGMDIVVTHVKQSALPALVFPDGAPPAACQLHTAVTLFFCIKTIDCRRSPGHPQTHGTRRQLVSVSSTTLPPGLW